MENNIWRIVPFCLPECKRPRGRSLGGLLLFLVRVKQRDRSVSVVLLSRLAVLFVPIAVKPNTSSDFAAEAVLELPRFQEGIDQVESARTIVQTTRPGVDSAWIPTSSQHTKWLPSSVGRIIEFQAIQ